MKKVIKIISIILLIIALLILSISSFNYLMRDRNIINGYYKSEIYGDKYGFQHYTEYYKYYYNTDKDINFYRLYNKIDNEHIEEIKSYCNDFKERMNAQNRLNEYDFDESIIKEENYFIITKLSNSDGVSSNKKFYNYTVYIYDTNTHVLYCLHSS